MAIEAQQKHIESSREQHTAVESHALKEVHAEQQLMDKLLSHRARVGKRHRKS